MNKYFSAASSENASMQQGQQSLCEQERYDACLDEALGFTFPASDPVALNCSVTAFRVPKQEQRRASIDFIRHGPTPAQP